MAGPCFTVHLTQGAEDDLEALHGWIIENRSAADADALLDKLLANIGTLERFPLRGSIPKELETLGIADYRQILLTPYRLIYRVIETKVFVMVVADGRRDMQTLLEQRLLRG